MASIISAGTTSGTALNMAGDTSGVLQLATNGSTTALTINTSQNVGIGTASPSNLLHAYRNNTGQDAQVQIEQAGSGSPTLGFLETGVYAWLIGQYGSDNSFRIAASGADLNTSPRLVIDTSGNLLFNSGYGSAAVAYGCRAWVNFDGTAASNLTGTYTRTSPSTTLTVTATAHGLIVGNSVNLDFTTGTGLDGIYTVVTVANANTFTVTTVASTTTSGNVTLLRNTIRGSGNVSSITDNGTGDYTVNLTVAMPDINYAVSMSGGGGSTGQEGLFGIVAAPTTSAVRFESYTDSGTLVDRAYISFLIVR